MTGAASEPTAEFRRTAKKNGLLWLALLGLTGLSVVAARALPSAGLPLELAVSVVQVALVAIFFMQLRGARPLVRLTAAAASVFLLSMFSLTFCDLFTRY